MGNSVATGEVAVDIPMAVVVEVSIVALAMVEVGVDKFQYTHLEVA